MSTALEPQIKRTQPTRGIPSRSEWGRRYGLVIGFVLICTVLSLTTPGFLTVQNLLIIVRQISINGILAIGVTYVLITGGVDLSLGSVLALAGVVTASLAHPGQFPVIVPVFAGLATGAICGGVNGLVITRGRIAPFIVTLGMMTLARGLAFVVSQGKPVSNLSREFLLIGSSEILGIPTPVAILALVAAASHIVLKHLRLGRHLYAVGGNETAARFAGLNVSGVKVFAYVASGAMAGLAGVVLASRITTGQPNAGIGYELDAIAAVVIGGTSLSGGVGTIGGTLLGALLMGVINNGLDLLNVSAYYQQVIKGVIIIAAVWLDRNRHN